MLVHLAPLSKMSQSLCLCTDFRNRWLISKMILAIIFTGMLEQSSGSWIWYNFVIWLGVFRFLSRIQSFLGVPLLDFVWFIPKHLGLRFCYCKSYFYFMFFYMWNHNSSFCIIQYTQQPCFFFLHFNFSVGSFGFFW